MPPEESASNGLGGRFSCLECQQTFSRVEHLTRHSRSHSKERVFTCTSCRKGFYRIDALKRHEQVHKEPRRSGLGKGARACIPCAAARRKCSGGIPCLGCGKRSLACSYPETGFPKTGLLKRQSVAEDGMQSDHDSPVSGSCPDVQDRFQAGESDQGLNESSQPHRVELDNTQSSVSLPSMAEHSVVEFESTPVPTQEYPLMEGLNGQGSESWYDGNISSLNWLPHTWTPDFHIEVGNTFGSPHGMESPDTRNHHVGSGGFESAIEPLFAPYQGTDFRDGNEISSPGSHTTQSTGHYYVDGDGARLPRILKAPYQAAEHNSTRRHDETRNANTPFFFPASNESLDLDTNRANTNTLPLDTYHEIAQAFERTCVTSTHYSRFSSSGFPSLAAFTKFVQLYKDNFQAVLPFIPPASFDIFSSHWILMLALAAAGSQYVDFGYSTPMHEFLRRAIMAAAENGDQNGPDALVRTQAKLLNCVGMMYLGDAYTREFAKTYLVDLASFCNREWRMPDLARDEEIQNDSLPLTRRWKIWREVESRCRTGYCIWLLDCMWAFHFQIRPSLSLEDAIAPIPCQEVLWEATSALDWDQLYRCSTQSISLRSTVQLAYIEKRIQSSTGEFSRILCIHALFQRTWEVEKYFTQPLTLWNPTAEKQNIKAIQDSSSLWLPDIPTYSKWRNAACDCLDVLHWHANSVIGAASGMEHPTVLHLHLARVILLTPSRKIIQLAELMALEPSSNEIINLIEIIERWAKEDQYKARLAMIHAGVLFWHVRRYSIDAFYEPSSVFLATLALWAYGRFSSHIIPNNNAGERDDDDAESLFPTSMQLDRPADDELVQLFVKRGVTMKANIMGVGNLCSRKGHARVLREGRKLLNGLKNWGEAGRLVKILDQLIDVCQQEA